MKLLPILASMLLLGCAGSGGANPAPPPPAATPIPQGYRLVWEDAFSGSALDPSKWVVKTGARRQAINSAEAVSVKDGALVITTYTEGGTHYTGFLESAGKYEPRYGYMEARIRFQSSPGEWGAFWVQSPTMGKPVGDPATAGTEIDVVEHRAHSGTGGDLTGSYVMNLHWDGYGADHKSIGGSGRPAAGQPSLQGEWHVYGLLWTADGYIFYLDGVEQWRTTQAVSRRTSSARAWAARGGGHGVAPGTGRRVFRKEEREVPSTIGA